MEIISLISLITSNMVPLFGVLFYKWNVSSIIYLYWFENIVVGFYNVLKMSKISQSAPAETKPAQAGLAFFLIPFFMLHYGMFTFVHGVFVTVMFGSGLELDGSFFMALISLFISHGISYVTNFLGKKEYEKRELGTQMFAPYSRIVVIHLTILFSGAFVMSLGSPLPALVILVILKTAIDVMAHLASHVPVKVTITHSSV